MAIAPTASSTNERRETVCFSVASDERREAQGSTSMISSASGFESRAVTTHHPLFDSYQSARCLGPYRSLSASWRVQLKSHCRAGYNKGQPSCPSNRVRFFAALLNVREKPPDVLILFQSFSLLGNIWLLKRRTGTYLTKGETPQTVGFPQLGETP